MGKAPLPRWLGCLACRERNLSGGCRGVTFGALVSRSRGARHPPAAPRHYRLCAHGLSCRQRPFVRLCALRPLRFRLAQRFRPGPAALASARHAPEQ
jgi:hypothetical protein